MQKVGRRLRAEKIVSPDAASITNHTRLARDDCGIVGPDRFGLRCAGGKQPDLQVRFVPAASLDPDGVGSYVLFGQLAKLGLKYPSGFTFQVQMPSLSPVPTLHDRAADLLLRLTICRLNSMQPACRATHSHPCTIHDLICHSFVSAFSGPWLSAWCKTRNPTSGWSRSSTIVPSVC
jgi:hypothetical protein